MRYGLALNDMRSPNIENVTLVRLAASSEELADWADAQREQWRDGHWGKAYRQGSELEWYNPPFGGWTVGPIGSYDPVWEIPDGVNADSQLGQLVAWKG